MRVLVGSTGWGYKAFVKQMRINYAYQDITFSVSGATTTTTTTTKSNPVPEFSPLAVFPLMATVLVLASMLLPRIRKARMGAHQRGSASCTA